MFSSALDPVPCASISLKRIMVNIRSGYWAPAINALRHALEHQGKDEYDAAKRRLHAVTFAGTFSRRNKHSLTQHSGLVVLDYDCQDEAQAVGGRKLAAQEDCCAAAFLSPSARGFKVTVRCRRSDLVELDAATHPSAWTTAAAHFDAITGLSADHSGKDAPRLCFVSLDPDAHFNPKATHLEVDPPAPKDHRPSRKFRAAAEAEIARWEPTGPIRNPATYIETTFAALIARVERSAPGLQHVARRDCAIVAGTLVTATYDGAHIPAITFDEALAALVQAARVSGAKNIASATKTIIDGLRYGMDRPRNLKSRPPLALGGNPKVMLSGCCSGAVQGRGTEDVRATTGERERQLLCITFGFPPKACERKALDEDRIFLRRYSQHLQEQLAGCSEKAYSVKTYASRIREALDGHPWARKGCSRVGEWTLRDNNLIRELRQMWCCREDCPICAPWKRAQWAFRFEDELAGEDVYFTRLNEWDSRTVPVDVRSWFRLRIIGGYLIISNGAISARSQLEVAAGDESRLREALIAAVCKIHGREVARQRLVTAAAGCGLHSSKNRPCPESPSSIEFTAFATKVNSVNEALAHAVAVGAVVLATTGASPPHPKDSAATGRARINIQAAQEALYELRLGLIHPNLPPEEDTA